MDSEIFNFRTLLNTVVNKDSRLAVISKIKGKNEKKKKNVTAEELLLIKCWQVISLRKVPVFD